MHARMHARKSSKTFVDPSAFMVPPQKEKVDWMFDFVAEEKKNALNAVLTTINIIPCAKDSFYHCCCYCCSTCFLYCKYRVHILRNHEANLERDSWLREETLQIRRFAANPRIAHVRPRKSFKPNCKYFVRFHTKIVMNLLDQLLYTKTQLNQG